MNTLSHALLADVLASIENASGTPLGTAAYLQVQELVNQLPDDTKPEELKTLLAPLLCRSQEEQEQFYEIFKKSWARVQETGELEHEVIEHVEADTQVEKRKRRWGFVWYVLVALLAGGIYFLWRLPTEEKSQNIRSIINIQVGESDSYPIPMHMMGPSPEFKNACPRSDTAATIIHFDSTSIAVGRTPTGSDRYLARIHFTALRPGIDSLCIKYKTDSDALLPRHTLVFNVLDTLAAPPPTAKEEPEAPDTTLYQVRDIPYARDLNVLEPPEPTTFQQLLSDYEWLLKIAFILLTGLFLWWLARRIEQKRRRLIAEHQPNVKPPYSWNISLGAEPEVAFGDDFYALLLQLRRRESDELWRLDVPRTVRATVDKGGMPDFRYARQTRPAEYLLLIDRQNGRDHQARLFDLLYRHFRSQEVLVERYWYDEGDPRRCYNEAHPNGLSLRDLQYYHPQSRVLLLGNACALLHPGTGNLNKWVIQTFSAWSDRAVLSTQPLATFGRRERTLQEQFHVLPASLSGLRDAIELFDADEGKTPDLNPRRFPDAAQEPIQLIDNDLIKTIQSVAPGSSTTDTEHLTTHDSRFTIWIAACAMYPELHWDLTLQLGHLIDGIAPSDAVTSSHRLTAPTHHSPLTTHHLLQSLVRLPWFTEGEMPLEVRQTLLAWLEREHPETHYRLREGLHRLLSQNPPPEGSAAYDDYAMNLALNEWLYTRDQDRKKELQRDIAARLAAGQQADFMVLRMLDPGRSLTPEQFEVPADWKKHLQEKGFAFLNPRRAWWWAVPVWLVLCGLALWWQPERVGCKGLSEIYQNKEYCIENFEEWAIFREMVVQDKLLANELDTADSIVNFLSGIRWENRIITRDNAAIRAAIAKEANMFVSPSPANAKSRRTEIFLEVFAKGAAPTDLVDNKPYIDSISFLQNAAVAYFNEGVKIHNAYSSMWATVEQSAQKPVGANYRSRLEACAYFSRAQEINALLPDTAQLWYVRDAAKCDLPVVRQTSKPPPPALKDITISGQLNNAETKRSLYINEWMATKIEARGLAPASLSRGAFFHIRVPGDRKTPVELNITSPGFEPRRITIRPTDFGKYQNVALQQSEKCYSTLRDDGITFLIEHNFKQAEEKFAAAMRCPDIPLADIDVPGFLKLVQDSIAEIERKRLLWNQNEQKRLDANRQANADDDGDGVANKDDQCPTEKGPAQTKGCPDQDGDGIPDKDDKCPTEKGSADNGGCPGKDLAAVLAEIDANMVTVAGGAFRMGCDEKRDGNCQDSEKPLHSVSVERFTLSKYEVTQEQWQAVMGNNPSNFKNCDNCPVEQVSWDDVQSFLTKLNTLTGKTYRLPTETEWEFAARGGTKSRDYLYSGSNELDQVAWYGDNSGKKTHAVGTKKTNELGLYDISGNVDEWCSDWYGEYNMQKTTVNNPQGPAKGSLRVLRGGSWNSPQVCRVAFRNVGAPGSRSDFLGFRLARTL